MRIAGHAYTPNGLRARNDQGEMPCAICGRGPGAHAQVAMPESSARTPLRQIPGRSGRRRTHGLEWVSPESVPGAVLSAEAESRLRRDLRALDEHVARARVSARSYVLYR